MKERPILFNAQMVRAILEGRKTQTRRVVNPQPHCEPRFHQDGLALHMKKQGMTTSIHSPLIAEHCPYGQPGDRLWVRETFCHKWDDSCGFIDEYWYRATSPGVEHVDGDHKSPWIPSIHMPRRASRILLEIVSVRVERLNDISEADADAEGCERLDTERDEHDWKLCPKCGGTRLHNALCGNGGVIFDVDCRECDTYVKRYHHLWESINGPGSWQANPWVWVVEFKRVTP